MTGTPTMPERSDIIPDIASDRASYQARHVARFSGPH
jgi:hypothetical protein